ncbi:Ig-like domain-containing protein [Anaerotalea alkaliphila]|uniref:BIG2 domain-containing protein n=1 Tax=Anaerotalea alkaliphila TaxID=2662126 RepID=A0A7X5HXY7_9FIRM|nr:hypothetical protein [Anaerotalea alkaliphila]
MALDKATLALPQGATEMLTATIGPDNINKVLKWSSSDESAVTVDRHGRVTAVGTVGASATITATVTTGSTTRSAACTVTVVEPVEVTSVRTIHTSLKIRQSDIFTLSWIKTVLGNAVILTAGSGDKEVHAPVTWGDTNPANFDPVFTWDPDRPGVYLSVTFTPVGTYTLTGTFTLPGGYVDEAEPILPANVTIDIIVVESL